MSGNVIAKFVVDLQNNANEYEFFYFGHACNSQLREAKAAFCGVDVVVIAFQQQLNQANFC